MIYLKLSAFVTLLPRNKILRGKHEKSCNSILKLISINRNTIDIIILHCTYIIILHIQMSHFLSYIKMNITHKCQIKNDYETKYLRRKYITQ